jgi:plastocyanin
VLSVTAVDGASSMSFEISGTPRPGLVSVTFANKGKYTHEMSISKMKPGVTLTQLKAALAKGGPEQAAALLVDPDKAYPMPSMLGPGRAETVTTRLSAGHYVVVCFLPGPDGMPHAAMGMIGEVTVDGTDAGAAPPATKGTVALTDSGINVPAGFGAGGTFEIKNAGSKVHDFSVVRLRGTTLPAMFQCVGGALGKGTVVDTCPGTVVAGIQDLAPGQSAYLSVTLPAASYSYLSTKGQGADMQAGLSGTFTVG